MNRTAAKIIGGTAATAAPVVAYLAYDYRTRHPMREMADYDPTEGLVRLHNLLVRRTALLPPRTMTLADLARYDGRGGRPTYFSAGGMVYDASTSAMFKSAYSQWAGRDATIALAKMSLRPGDVNRTDWDAMTEADRKSLDSWTDYFDEKYMIKGRLEEYGDR